MVIDLFHIYIFSIYNIGILGIFLFYVIIATNLCVCQESLKKYITLRVTGILGLYKGANIE